MNWNPLLSLQKNIEQVNSFKYFPNLYKFSRIILFINLDQYFFYFLIMLIFWIQMNSLLILTEKLFKEHQSLTISIDISFILRRNSQILYLLMQPFLLNFYHCHFQFQKKILCFLFNNFVKSILWSDLCLQHLHLSIKKFFYYRISNWKFILMVNKFQSLPYQLRNFKFIVLLIPY